MEQIKWTYVDNNHGLRIFERYGISKKAGRYEFLFVNMIDASPNCFCMYRTELGKLVTRTATLDCDEDIYGFISSLVETFLDDTGIDPTEKTSTDGNMLEYPLSDIALKDVELLKGSPLLKRAKYVYPESDSELSKTGHVSLVVDIECNEDGFPCYKISCALYHYDTMLPSSGMSYNIPLSFLCNSMMPNLADGAKRMLLEEVDKVLRNVIYSKVETFKSLFGV